MVRYISASTQKINEIKQDISEDRRDKIYVELVKHRVQRKPKILVVLYEGLKNVVDAQIKGFR